MTKNPPVVDLFCDLVKVDSVTGEEAEFRDFLVDLLKKEELVDLLKVDQFGNVHGFKRGEGEPLFLAAHLDTVEPGRGIKPQIKNGVIKSDGTTILGADNKVAVAAIIQALRDIKGQKHCPIEIVFTLSEEIGNYGAVNFDYSLLQARIGYSFDYSFPIGYFITASPFYERFDLVLKGKEAHAARSSEGINVLEIFSEILSHWKLGKLDSETIFNIGKIEAGFARNTVPGSMSINGEIRGFDEGRISHYKKDFERLVSESCKKAKASFEIEWVRENPGYKLSKDFSQNVSQKIKDAGFVPRAEVGWGVSDVNIFCEHNIQCVNLGSGAIGAHTLSESVSVKSLEDLTKLICNLVI